MSILAATGLALGMVILGLVPINLSFVKNNIEQHLRENLGLDVTFQGPLRLRLGPKPRVDGAAIEIRKLGAANEVLARVDAVSLSPHLIEILRGRIHVESIHIADVAFDYCAELPAFGNNETSAEPLPSIAANDLKVTNLQLYCGTPGDELSLNVVVAELNGSAPANESMSGTVRGRVKDLPIELEAHGGSLNSLLASPDSFPLQLSISPQGAEFRLEGVINDPLDRLELRADTSLRAKNAQSILSKLGMSVSEVAEIEFSSEVWLDDGTFGIESFVGKLGRTAIDARGLARFSLERRYYELDVQLGQLQAGLFGSESVMSEENDDSEAFDLPPLFNALRDFDGNIQVTADQLTDGVIRVDNLELEGSLSDGNLVLSRYQMHLMGSPFEGEARLDLHSV